MVKENTEALELIRKLPDEETTDAIIEERHFELKWTRDCSMCRGQLITHQEPKKESS